MANIITECTWTTTTGRQYLNEVPRLYAKTFDISNNEIANSLKSWAEALDSKGGIDYYNTLHSAQLKETWTFPYFEDTVRDFSNEWGDSFVYSIGGGNMAGSDWAGNVSDLMKNLASTVAGAELLKDALIGADKGQAAAGVLYEPPKFYQYSANDGSISVNFVLINTEKPEDADKHYELVKRLISENRFTRLSGLKTRPPVLWSVTVPGYRAIRWASCDVNIGLLGKRLMRNNAIIPEGYKVSLTFKSLYTEPSNFMSEVNNNSSLG